MIDAGTCPDKNYLALHTKSYLYVQLPHLRVYSNLRLEDYN